MNNLVEAYIKAFSFFSEYIEGILSHFIPNNITLPSGYWTDFLFLGYTDLKSYLVFIFNIVVFATIHYLLYRAFKWLIKFIGGVFYV